MDPADCPKGRTKQKDSPLHKYPFLSLSPSPVSLFLFCELGWFGRGGDEEGEGRRYNTCGRWEEGICVLVAKVGRWSQKKTYIISFENFDFD